MTAAATATGFRAWLANHHFGWLTPRRLRAITIAAMSAATIVATVGVSGSGSARPAAPAPAHRAPAP